MQINNSTWDHLWQYAIFEVLLGHHPQIAQTITWGWGGIVLSRNLRHLKRLWSCGRPRMGVTWLFKPPTYGHTMNWISKVIGFDGVGWVPSPGLVQTLSWKQNDELWMVHSYMVHISKSLTFVYDTNPFSVHKTSLQNFTSQARNCVSWCWRTTWTSALWRWSWRNRGWFPMAKKRRGSGWPSNTCKQLSLGQRILFEPNHMVIVYIYMSGSIIYIIRSRFPVSSGILACFLTCIIL